LVPARLSAADEKRWVATMLERLAARERRRRPTDDALLERARDLSRRFLDDAVTPRSVRWVANQRTRWGSCTPQDGTIRLSDRLLGMPGWVIDYVLIHELAHLREPGHGPGFWQLVRRYPKADRARGYLEGVAATANLPIAADTDTEVPDAAAPDADVPDPEALRPEERTDSEPFDPELPDPELPEPERPDPEIPDTAVLDADVLDLEAAGPGGAAAGPGGAADDVDDAGGGAGAATGEVVS
jgi:hypothetical protein